MITILDDFPVVMTQDKEWAETYGDPFRRGNIIVLPEDAVLVMPPMVTMSQETMPLDPAYPQPDETVDE